MEHRDPGPDTAARPVGAVRAVLLDWDPIGVLRHGAPDDEYDCLIAPLLDLRTAGVGAAGIGEFLHRELADHFGLNPAFHAEGIETVARRVAALGLPS